MSLTPAKFFSQGYSFMFIYRAPLNKEFYAILQNYASQHIILSQCKTYQWFRGYLDFLVPQFFRNLQPIAILELRGQLGYLVSSTVGKD